MWTTGEFVKVFGWSGQSNGLIPMDPFNPPAIRPLEK